MNNEESLAIDHVKQASRLQTNALASIAASRQESDAGLASMHVMRAQVMATLACSHATLATYHGGVVRGD